MTRWRRRKPSGGRPRTVDIAAEWLEVQRRRYHEQLRRDLEAAKAKPKQEQEQRGSPRPGSAWSWYSLTPVTGTSGRTSEQPRIPTGLRWPGLSVRDELERGRRDLVPGSRRGGRPLIRRRSGRAAGLDRGS
jgi:hypothetical protein